MNLRNSLVDNELVSEVVLLDDGCLGHQLEILVVFDQIRSYMESRGTRVNFREKCITGDTLHDPGVISIISALFSGSI